MALVKARSIPTQKRCAKVWRQSNKSKCACFCVVVRVHEGEHGTMQVSVLRGPRKIHEIELHSLTARDFRVTMRGRLPASQ
jgi:hypothetical protein